jgi:hypothetical protein
MRPPFLSAEGFPAASLQQYPPGDILRTIGLWSDAIEPIAVSDGN